MTIQTNQPLIIASASPRRRELLADAGIAFEVTPADIPEPEIPGESPEDHVRRLARDKAEAVAEQHPDRLVLGADTVVVLDGRIFGKPTSPDDAERMLSELSGSSHVVLTGVCLRCVESNLVDCWVSTTTVRFRALDADAIRRYTALVNTLDKAGAYAIQEHGDMLVAEVDGLVSNVIGLPVEDVVERLKAGAR